MRNIVYSAMLTLALSFATTAYSDAVSSDLKNGLVRLHVVANSDSDEDQSIKLAVRDRILSGLTLTTPEASAEQAEKIADEVLRENGFSYTSYAEFTTAYFPKKQYMEFTLPQGEYRAVRVVLGEGRGKNWWCVLYPPVCMADVRGEGTGAREQLRQRLDNETCEVITGAVDVRFRILEWIGALSG